MLVIRLACLFLLFTSFNALYAQYRVFGKVVNASQSPVPFAALMLKRIAEAQERTAQTDSTGTFSFDKVTTGTYSIRISSIGYEAYSLLFEVSKDTSFTIQLPQS